MPQKLRLRGLLKTLDNYYKTYWIASYCCEYGKSRNSRTKVFFKIGVLKNFSALTGKHLCQSLFFNKKTCNFIKKRLRHRCFPVKLAKFSWTSILKKICEWLLLNIANLRFSWNDYSDKEGNNSRRIIKIQVTYKSLSTL